MSTNRSSMLRNRQGFTLVEIAIVLVIVGLLLAGVLKGQSMIESTKFKSQYKQVQELQAAVYQYQDKFGALPGDDRGASGRFPGCTTAALDGNGDGIITNASSGTAGTNEQFKALNHLACAGLIPGSYNGTSDKFINKYGTDMVVYTGTAAAAAGVTGSSAKTGLAIYFYSLDGAIAKNLDTTYDDGSYGMGSIRGGGTADYVAGTAAPVFIFF